MRTPHLTSVLVAGAVVLAGCSADAPGPPPSTSTESSPTGSSPVESSASESTEEPWSAPVTVVDVTAVGVTTPDEARRLLQQVADTVPSVGLSHTSAVAEDVIRTSLAGRLSAEDRSTVVSALSALPGTSVTAKDVDGTDVDLRVAERFVGSDPADALDDVSSTFARALVAAGGNGLSRSFVDGTDLVLHYAGERLPAGTVEDLRTLVAEDLEVPTTAVEASRSRPPAPQP